MHGFGLKFKTKKRASIYCKVLANDATAHVAKNTKREAFQLLRTLRCLCAGALQISSKAFSRYGHVNGTQYSALAITSVGREHIDVCNKFDHISDTERFGVRNVSCRYVHVYITLTFRCKVYVYVCMLCTNSVYALVSVLTL